MWSAPGAGDRRRGRFSLRVTRAVAACLIVLAGACAPPAPVVTLPVQILDIPGDSTVRLHPRYVAVVEPPRFTRAVERGTRTRTGQPGQRYWQQYARYRLDASLDTATRQLVGSGTIR